MTEYRDFGKYPSYKNFVKYGTFHMLKETIETFFHCHVEVYAHAQTQILKNFQINILDNPRRGYYPIDENNVVIVARIIEKRQLISAIGFHLSGNRIGENVKLLNKFEGAISGTFSQEFNNFFQYGTLAFGDELIKHTITNYLCKGFYDFKNIRHLIEYFFKLRTTSFEGTFFSTGVILTKSFHDFSGVTNRFGKVYELENWIRLRSSNKINKRLWYLADGKKTFFLGTKNLDFINLFALDEEYISTNYLDNHSLSLTLRGGDLLFKVENEKLFSINTASGFEFLFFENQWKFRNYNFLRKIISENVTTNEDLIDSIIFFLLSCSKKQISSILWFPERIDEIDNLIQTETKNNFIKQKVNIKDKRFINHIFRCLSSDGASIINKDGDLVHLGVIVDLSKIKVAGLKGTGESAASALASNGISVKISQDGNIKIFLESGKEPLLF
jgi:hypothetical protein